MSLRNGAPRPVEDAASGGWEPGEPYESELLGGYDLPTAYDARPARPLLQRAARAALWSAVAVGFLGGVAGFVGRSPTAAQPVADRGDLDAGLPAPVAGTAERAVRAWLSVTSADESRDLEELFVEPPLPRIEEGSTLVAEDVRTVAGERQLDGYWSATVAARVVETPTAVDGVDGGASDPVVDAPVDVLAGSGEGTVDDEQGPVRSTWYVQIGIVGDDATGLRALTTPSLLPARPVTAAEGWQSSAASPAPPSPDDPVASTVQGFLRALLADGGDPQRYLATGLEIDAADPATFVSVDLASLAVDGLDGGEMRALAQVEGRTARGLTVASSYEFILVERTDRLEITGFSGAPTLVVPPPDDAGSADPGAGGPGSGTGAGDGGP